MSYMKKVFDTMVHNKQYANLYKSMNIQLFDTSLRDGIQCAPSILYPLQRKIDVLHNITTQYQPQSIEVGSFVSSKVLPIMEDTPILYNVACKYYECFSKCNTQRIAPKVYVLVPNSNRLIQAIDHGVKRFSFITSVSDDFQKKNTGKNIEDTKAELEHCFDLLDKMLPNEEYTTKLYISCIPKCPIQGKIALSTVVHEIIEYNRRFSFDELCLSDTCGTLQYLDFEHIISEIAFQNVPLNKISLHLHVNPNTTDNLESILNLCFRTSISKFDVSILDEGGCSVTMKGTNEPMYPNMTYEFFYSCLDKYLEGKMN
jgi:isopropylmalate/homocitrate/citramalate synthase